MTPLRIVFMGTPDFAVPSLRVLAESNHDVVGVVTQPDRRSGRGKKVKYTPVKEAALAYDIEVFQPEKLRANDEAFSRIVAWKPDVAVVAAYGQILPQRFLDIPRLGCVNVHASLLPKFRGASPINMAIVEGESVSGVTLMQMEAGLDTGPMLATFETPIAELETAQGLHDRLARLGAEGLVETLEALDAGEIAPVEQDHEKSTYAGLLQKSDAEIDWTADAPAVANLIRGFNPWPGAYSFLQHEDPLRVKFHLARPSDGTGQPGHIIQADGDVLEIACGTGAIEVLTLQPAGKSAMTPREFINGFQPSKSDFFA